MKCSVCYSSDMIRGTIRKTKKVIAGCMECGKVYDTDLNGNPILELDPLKKEYYLALEKSFGSWDELDNVTKYPITE